MARFLMSWSPTNGWSDLDGIWQVSYEVYWNIKFRTASDGALLATKKEK